MAEFEGKQLKITQSVHREIKSIWNFSKAVIGAVI